VKLRIETCIETKLDGDRIPDRAECRAFAFVLDQARRKKDVLSLGAPSR
jgi:hypothetical protein